LRRQFVSVAIGNPEMHIVEIILGVDYHRLRKSKIESLASRV